MTHTKEQLAFISAIIANPDDDAPRLIYADWLDENGQEDYAEFVRLQIALKDVPKQSLKMYAQDCMCQTCQTINRIKHLNKYARDQLRLTPHIFDKCAHGFDWTFWESTPKCPQIVRRRGFVDEIRCKIDEWMSKGPEIVREHPITQVAFSNFVLWTPQQGGQQSYFIFDRASFRDDPVGNGVVPTGLFEKLKASKYMSKSSLIASCCSYGTSQEALSDLSQAAIAWAKSQLPTALLSSLHGQATTTTTSSTSQRAEAEHAAIADSQK